MDQAAAIGNMVMHVFEGGKTVKDRQALPSGTVWMLIRYPA